MSTQTGLWLIFGIVILVMAVLDLGVLNRKAHAVSMREALIMSGIWIFLALLFNLGIYFWQGPEKAMMFLTGYVVEESLSVDNLFVFLVLFSFFQVPRAYQHKVLFWGIIGAMLMRALFIGVGVSLLHRFHGIIYIFGAFLLYTGIKLALEKEKEIHPENNPVIRLFRKILPVREQYVGDHFFIRQDGRTWATPLFIVLLVVETTDVIFAVDSIPAIFAITTDPFIVYTSNIFAVMGLRSLFFALSGFMQMFHYLNYGLSVVLAFIGVKMLVADFWAIPVGAALGVILGVLALSVAASLIWKPREVAGPGPS
ncbi:MAG: TerC family protein [Candidatus Firestonebacteria bacterium]|nr:TerC family protein [Candidatus Firestonebacteria bacterium]